MNKHLLLAAAALIAAPALAQSADKPLGDILDAIPDEGEQAEAPPPPAPPPPPPVPRDGIGSAELPPSAIEPLAPPAPAPEEEPIVLTEEQQKQAELEEAERRRVEELNRAAIARNEENTRRYEEALLAHQRSVAAAEAEAARVAAEHQAEVERLRQQAVRERSLWEARVRACNDGDRTQCAQPGELPEKKKK